MTQSQPLSTSESVTVHGKIDVGYDEILTEEALDFVVGLHREFSNRRRQLLRRREDKQRAIDGGKNLDFPTETIDIRRGDWEVAPVPQALQKRHVEITGPVSRKMIINALNSGADVFMADFEDANSPTWQNVMEGQLNLRDAIRRNIDFYDERRGKSYELVDDPATLMVRPRGWHLDERHISIDGQPVAASLVDFGLYFFHNAEELMSRNKGPYFYLPKLESHLEARLWNDVFEYSQDRLDIPRGTIKATVLLETIHAAFEMDEILFELQQHSAGLNAGRWDYIFSAIKTFRNRPQALLPDRSQVTMTVPFMKAYSDRLVKVCHRRGAHAIGGMAAFIPTSDEKTNKAAIEAVRNDKERESQAGFDGTWVAHPGLVSVARKAFDAVLKGEDHQRDMMRDDVEVDADDLVNFEIPGATITEGGFRTNINVGIRYIESWLQGVGAAAINNLMEDAATAEISRSQVWQWLHHDQAKLSDGRPINDELYEDFVDREMDQIRREVGAERFESGKFERARAIFDQVARDDKFPEFFTLVAYGELG